MIGSDPAPGGGADESGHAYIFEVDDQDQWREVARLSAPEPTDEDGFGMRVGLGDDIAVVGAPGSNQYTGAAYVFERQPDGAWTLASRLTAPDAVARGWFGNAVAASGSTVLVQALAHAVGDSTGLGGIYVYDRDEAGSWELLRKIDPVDYAGLDTFGGSLLAYGAGFTADGSDAEGEERVYIFDGPGGRGDQ